MHNFEYVGCFFDYEELHRCIEDIRRTPLKNNKIKPHVTFEYGPQCGDETLFGEKITAVITGYGNDGENEGLKVLLSGENDRINDMIRKIAVPHITIAVSDTGQAVNTRYLNFAEIEPRQIIGHYNGHIDE